MIGHQSRLIGIAQCYAAVPTHSAPVPGQGTWQSTLHARDIDGNGSTDACYDSAVNTTGMADWSSSGPMTFEDALDGAAKLIVVGLGGWRLPATADTGAPGCNSPRDHGTECGFDSHTTTSELPHMFYTTPGLLALLAPGDDLA